MAKEISVKFQLNWSKGNESINVTANDQTCHWTPTIPTPRENWIAITSGPSTGNGAVTFTAQRNPSTTQTRETTVTAGDTTAIIRQIVPAGRQRAVH